MSDGALDVNSMLASLMWGTIGGGLTSTSSKSALLGVAPPQIVAPRDMSAELVER